MNFRGKTSFLDYFVANSPTASFIVAPLYLWGAKERPVYIKGTLYFNGNNSWPVTSIFKNAIKVIKELGFTLTAENHAISHCEINVLSASKDDINAECDDKATVFTTEEYSN